MNDTPQISIMTVVYNGEKNLDECLESVAAQTFTDFEIVIINDGSTDTTSEILSSWQKRDSRIRVLNNPQNRGRPFSRNRALTAARAPLVAVLDADDYAYPERLALQFDFIRNNPDVQVLGGDIKIHGSEQILTHPRDDGDIRADLFFDSSLFHSTVMMRKSILNATKTWYDPELTLSQDYGLWASLLFSPLAKFANLPVPLCAYRLPEKPRPGYAEKQFNFANRVRARILQKMGLPPVKENMATHLALLYGNAEKLGVSPEECVNWAKRLSEANQRVQLAPPAALDRQIAGRLQKITACKGSL